MPGRSRCSRCGRAARYLPARRRSNRSARARHATIRVRMQRAGIAVPGGPRRTSNRTTDATVWLRAGHRVLMEGEPDLRSEEHTSELQSLMRISYAVFCLKKKTVKTRSNDHERQHKKI